jgi:pyroglutamyl-peptidase
MILISGFKPFGGEKINPSLDLVEEVSTLPNVAACILPVEYDRAFSVLEEAIKKYNPSKVIMFGQAGGRAKICLEKIALNWNQTYSADESGFIPPTDHIIHGRPLAEMTKFSVDDLYKKLKHEGYPVEISFSAGAFVCNNVYYKVLTQYTELPSLFVHVPYLPSQGKSDQPKMDFSTMVEVAKKIVTMAIS